MSETWAKLNIKAFFEDHLSSSSSPISHLVMYFCGKTGVLALLPALSALVFYTNIFYILKDLYRRHEISAYSLSLALLFLMSSDIFVELISGVRCYAATAILARCFYDEIFNKKSPAKNIVWCVIASLMHSFALVLYCIRIFLLIFSMRKWLLNVFTIMVVLITINIWGRDFVQEAIDKATSYIYGDGYSFGWGYLLCAIGLSIIFLSQFYSKQYYFGELNDVPLRRLMGIVTCFILIAVVFFFEYSIFRRSTVFITTLMTPIVCILCEKVRGNNYQVYVKLISVAMLFISCVRGNLCGYKFFLLW